MSLWAYPGNPGNTPEILFRPAMIHTLKFVETKMQRKGLLDLSECELRHVSIKSSSFHTTSGSLLCPDQICSKCFQTVISSYAHKSLVSQYVWSSEDISGTENKFLFFHYYYFFRISFWRIDTFVSVQLWSVNMSLYLSPLFLGWIRTSTTLTYNFLCLYWELYLLFSLFKLHSFHLKQ